MSGLEINGPTEWEPVTFSRAQVKWLKVTCHETVVYIPSTLKDAQRVESAYFQGDFTNYPEIFKKAISAFISDNDARQTTKERLIKHKICLSSFVNFTALFSRCIRSGDLDEFDGVFIRLQNESSYSLCWISFIEDCFRLPGHLPSEADEAAIAAASAGSSDAAQPSTPKRDLPKGKGKGKEKESDSPPIVSPSGSPPVSPDKGVPLPVAGSVFAGASAPPLSPELRRRAGISRAAFDRAFQVGSSSAAARKELRMPFQRHPYAYRSVLGAPTGPTAPPPSKMHEAGGGASTSYTTIPAAAAAPVPIPQPVGDSSMSTSPSSVGSSGSSDGEFPGLRLSDTSEGSDLPPPPSPTTERSYKGEDSDSSPSSATLSSSSDEETRVVTQKGPRPEHEREEEISRACSSAQAAAQPVKMTSSPTDDTPVTHIVPGYKFDGNHFYGGKIYKNTVTVNGLNKDGSLTVTIFTNVNGNDRKAVVKLKPDVNFKFLRGCATVYATKVRKKYS